MRGKGKRLRKSHVSPLPPSAHAEAKYASCRGDNQKVPELELPSEQEQERIANMSAVALLEAMEAGKLTATTILSVFIKRSSTLGVETFNVAEENYVEAMAMAKDADERRKKPSKDRVRSIPTLFHHCVLLTRAATSPSAASRASRSASRTSTTRKALTRRAALPAAPSSRPTRTAILSPCCVPREPSPLSAPTSRSCSCFPSRRTPSGAAPRTRSTRRARLADPRAARAACSASAARRSAWAPTLAARCAFRPTFAARPRSSRRRSGACSRVSRTRARTTATARRPSGYVCTCLSSTCLPL